jgi:hypothetical protein
MWLDVSMVTIASITESVSARSRSLARVFASASSRLSSRSTSPPTSRAMAGAATTLITSRLTESGAYWNKPPGSEASAATKMTMNAALARADRTPPRTAATATVNNSGIPGEGTGTTNRRTTMAAIVASVTIGPSN